MNVSILSGQKMYSSAQNNSQKQKMLTFSQVINFTSQLSFSD